MSLITLNLCVVICIPSQLANLESCHDIALFLPEFLQTRTTLSLESIWLKAKDINVFFVLFDSFNIYILDSVFFLFTCG